MDKLIFFAILSLPVVYISWRTLFDIRSHGFYRFFSWECIIILVVFNFRTWFDNPFSFTQIISWILLLISVYPLISGVIMLKRFGKTKHDRNEETLYKFEKTTELVDKGIYKYIRHPLYSSLLFLTWGIYFKSTVLGLFFVALLSSLFLYLTAIHDEKECIEFFGEKYKEYMKRSKRFIPFIF